MCRKVGGILYGYFILIESFLIFLCGASYYAPVLMLHLSLEGRATSLKSKFVLFLEGLGVISKGFDVVLLFLLIECLY